MSYADLARTVADLVRHEPVAAADRQAFYERVHAWALRGMGYGLGDHPETSGERAVLEVLAKRCARPIVFDVGANRGNWSAMVRARFDVAAEIHCFEPSEVALGTLRTRDIRGAFTAKIHPFGLSDVEGRRHLHTDALGSGMASVYHRRLEHFGRSHDKIEHAGFRRLDAACSDLNVSQIDLLKLDVEGHEFDVLRGAGNMLTSGAIGMIQFEFGGCNLDSGTTFQDFWYLLSPHYDLYRVVQDGIVPIPNYREQDEVYICSNFVAIWRDK